MQPFSDDNISTYLSGNADIVETYKRQRDIINERLKLVTGYGYHDQDKVDVSKHIAIRNTTTK